MQASVLSDSAPLQPQGDRPSDRGVKIAQAFQRPAPKPLPELKPQPQLPPADDLLKPSTPQTPSEIAPGDDSVTIVVKQFKVVGNTVFSEKQLATVLEPFTNRPLTLTELLQVRSAVTKLYHDAGYVTSGAYIPPQDPQNDTITIQVIEGRVETINVKGNHRLRSRYVQSRLELATKPPLNINQLVDKLRLLQLNPLIKNVSAELSAGVQPGTSILNVTIAEANTFSVDLATDNNRTPTVGSWQRLVTLREANLLGLGDGLTIGYINTSGSNEVDASYSLPLNPRDGTLNFNYQFVTSRVVEDPFEVLDIHSNSQYYDLSYRQPIIKTPTEELALSLTGSYQQSRTEFLKDLLGEAIPFPSFGADENGRIRVAAVRFGQEWTKRGKQEVFSLRSLFNVGFLASDALPLANNAPDDTFFSWQGQFQWVRLLAPDTLFLFRSQAQFTGNTLTSLEQSSLGGWQTVRGYRQDQLFTDNGFQASAEVRLPLYRNRNLNGLLQGLAFFDVGTGWNTQLPDPDSNVLAGIGIGLLWQMGDRFTARLDWGIPLIDAQFEKKTLQEHGLYFSIRYTAF
ncbi:MAG: ShlB/FhaC/HecB family hemolysin secretion/activation protein [Leptolyngbya sp. BL-A-14]